MGKHGLWALRTGVLIAAATPATGQVSPVALNRSISGSTAISAEFFCDPGSDSDSGRLTGDSSYGAWNSDLRVEAAVCDGHYWTYVDSGQTSGVEPGMIYGSLRVAHAHAGLPSLSLVDSHAESEFRHDFRVRTRTSFTLSLDFRGTGESYSMVELWGPEGWITGRSSSDELSFTESGELSPGQYWIVGELSLDYSAADSGSGHGTGTCDFELSLGVPECLCDWNTDGALGSPDFFAFLDSFFAQDADVNFDGVTTSQDYFDFLVCLFAPPGACL